MYIYKSHLYMYIFVECTSLICICTSLFIQRCTYTKMYIYKSKMYKSQISNSRSRLLSLSCARAHFLSLSLSLCVFVSTAGVCVCACVHACARARVRVRTCRASEHATLYVCVYARVNFNPPDHCWVVARLRHLFQGPARIVAASCCREIAKTRR